MILRKRSRYVLIEASRPIGMSSISQADEFKREILSFLGERTYFRANPHVIAQPRENAFIISVNRGYEKDAVLASSFIKRLGGGRIGLYTIKTSGTVRSLKNYIRKAYGS